VKRVLFTMAVTGFLAVACSGAFAQTRYSPPDSPSTPPPTQTSPDPFGLTLAGFGTAAAVGYVMRRKRGTS
jgi:hypothetical protein